MKNNLTILILTFCLLAINYMAIGQTPIYKDPNQPIEARAKDLVSKMTLEEKVLQMMHTAPAIPRLDLPAYNWWNEALHGVGRSGSATVFPQAIGLGATFDSDLALRVSSVISDEARAMYNAAIAKDYHQKYGGLTFWTPNVNIFRDPRWGRGQETYGEDPFLTSALGVAFVKGLQGEDPKYLKTAACAKHYAVHSGPERLRHEFNAVASKKDMFETYLPAFHALVDADVEAVMCAYNATNGEPCCSNKYLLQDLLRKDWGFDGHVVSDCWAVVDFYEGHKNVKNVTEAAALAVNSGVNLNCGDEYPALVDAVKQGLITEETIDNTLAHLLETRFKLGMFDPKENVPYNNISPEVINSKEHRALAKEVATKSIVLLKNNGVLPLKNDLPTYYVTGPSAANVESLVGNYYGVNPEMVTVLEGITKAIEPGSQLQYRPGVLLDRENVNPIDWSSDVAAISDATFMVMGINGLIEGEEGESIASEHFGDRLDYNLPKNQIDYLKKLKKDNDNAVIAIVTGGSPMNLAEVQEIADAVLLVWYPGEEGGNAVADIVFGKTSPSGRLPITFPKSLDQLPNYQNYDMEGRTYRYMKEEPLYPFGYGLSYTTFNYSDIQLSSTTARKKKIEPITVSALVKNTGKYEAEEVVQFYITDKEGSARTPLYSLKGVKRIKLKPGASERVSFSITEDMLSLVDNEGKSILEKGDFDIFIGGSLPDKRSNALGMPAVAKSTLTLK
ncbi:glycoside hydrolase family 3 C-terminal domain-containing protein [Fulvivirga sp. 2943]|uniref:Glycoside hydrolase family 3 C-terminal domain-containing protein n=2 Tax=Fulvivirga sediminis TaxID=2803949 RepID=A0A937F5U0_9BACT|nr:glycoside hydrolase family 3 C-terminal domain-containing protein [Fulvivirga sediminis]